MKIIKASVIIPLYMRQESIERAISSILNQRGSEFVEIIVVDDSSPILYQPKSLRQQDKFIRLDRNNGPANARNVGLDAATGKIIYFLDSDDYFIQRDFESDYVQVIGNKSLFYCDYKSGSKTSKFPETILSEDYFRAIFNDYHGICNTCTMVFDASLNVRFDSDLPKHEDWDFVYFNFIKNGSGIKKIKGLSYVDRSDKKSLSRLPDCNKDLPWLKKLSKSLQKEEFGYVEFCILAKYKSCINWRRFFLDSIFYVRRRKMNYFSFLKKIVQRLLFK